LPNIPSSLRDLFHLFLPNNCKACTSGLRQGEHFICFHCIAQLPKTNYHTQTNNPVQRILWGRVHFQKATSWLHYSKGGLVQRLLYELKYNNQQQLGVHLGELLGMDLQSANFFDEMDLVIPIPLHVKKQFKRGYNQSVRIAEGISKVANLELDNTSVIRKIENPTQTRKSRMSRWENVSEIMEVINEDALKGKHILLLDDVITTGSTIEAMTSVMETIPKIKISVLTLCWASDF